MVQKLTMCCSDVDVRRAAWENVKWFIWVVGKWTMDFANMGWRLYFNSHVCSRLSSLSTLSNLATNVTCSRHSTCFTSRFWRCNWTRNHTSICRVDIKYLINKYVRNILCLQARDKVGMLVVNTISTFVSCLPSRQVQTSNNQPSLTVTRVHSARLQYLGQADQCLK